MVYTNWIVSFFLMGLFVLGVGLLWKDSQRDF